MLSEKMEKWLRRVAERTALPANTDMDGDFEAARQAAEFIRALLAYAEELEQADVFIPASRMVRVGRAQGEIHRIIAEIEKHG